jgi:hypothetical protein
VAYSEEKWASYDDTKGIGPDHQSLRGTYALGFVTVFNKAVPPTNFKADEVILTTDNLTRGYVALFRAGCATHVWKSDSAKINYMLVKTFSAL